MYQMKMRETRGCHGKRGSQRAGSVSDGALGSSLTLPARCRSRGNVALLGSLLLQALLQCLEACGVLLVLEGAHRLLVPPATTGRTEAAPRPATARPALTGPPEADVLQGVLGLALLERFEQVLETLVRVGALEFLVRVQVLQLL